MDQTLLELIDNYIKKNGIPFKDVWVTKEYFPEEFNKLLDKEVHKLNSRAKLDNEYCFTYDNNGNLVLLATSFNTRIVLCDSPKDVKTNYPCTKMYFEKIFYKSCINKYNKEEYDKFKQIIIEHDPMIDDESLEELLTKFMNVLNDKVDKELMKSNTDVVKRDGELLKDYIHSYTLIKDYIDYLNHEYNRNIQSDIIIYEQDKSDEKSYVTHSIIEKKPYAKKYSQIPVSERLATLESNGYMFKCQAKERGNDFIDHLCYLYRLNENTYEMVLEPYSGEGRTRIICIKEDNMSYEKFKKIAHDYLHLSNRDTLSAKNIAMLYHTTYDTFKNSLDYAITRNEDIPVNQYTKNNIDSLTEMEESPKLG